MASKGEVVNQIEEDATELRFGKGVGGDERGRVLLV